MANILTNRISAAEWQKHAREHPWIGEEDKSYSENPICPRCEKIALRHKGWTQNRTARCPSCGWTGRAPVLLREYKKEKMWR